jgi:WD40 repeat protein
MSIVAAWAWRRPARNRVAETLPVYETSIVLPDSMALAYVGSSPLGVGTPAFVVSPDGTTLVFVGRSGGTTRLYERRMDASAVAALPGTDGAYAPFFAPDGQSVGFFSGGMVKRTNLQSGATVSLAELVLPYGGVWLADGRILVAAQEGDQLVAIPSTGGAPVAIGSPELTRRAVFPSPLPGDSTVLMSTVDSHLAVTSTSTGRMDLLGPDGPLRVDSVKQTSRLFVGTNPRYVASGHLLYHSLDATVMAVPFDPGTRRALGPAVPVLSGVRLESIWGVGQLAVTRDGTLIYARGANGRLNALVWRDDRGRVDTLTAFGRADYGDLDLSPDGTRLVTHICTSQGSCAPRALRLAEGIQVTLPPDQATHIGAGTVGWADHGETVFDRRTTMPNGAPGGTTIYAPDDPARAQAVPRARVQDVARDGHVLFERDDSLFVAPSIAALISGQATAGFRLPEPDAWGLQLRQGADWVAYTARSEQAGEYVVFVARTHPPYEHWRASPRGGEEPIWSPDGALVYREGNRWMHVSVPNVPGGSPGAAQFLFAGPYLNVLGRSHDIAPDGRHLLIAGPSELTTTSLTVVTHWVTRLPGQTASR